jgi:hypothetical protein
MQARKPSPLAQGLLAPRRRRASVRATQERVGFAPAPGSWSGSGRAPCRPDDPRNARLRSRANASGAARGIVLSANGWPRSRFRLPQSALPRRVVRVRRTIAPGPELLAAGPGGTSLLLQGGLHERVSLVVSSAPPSRGRCDKHRKALERERSRRRPEHRRCNRRPKPRRRQSREW